MAELKKPAIKKTTKKVAAPKAAAKKKAVTATSDVEPAMLVQAEPQVQEVVEVKKVATEKVVPHGRYIFATGRRKTSVANVRLFEGKGEHVVNKKSLATYFSHKILQEESLQPFNVTGLGGQYYFLVNVKGGGPHSQAGAIRHGISKALSTLGEEVRKVLKKNGLLTRDPREKERKKPGLRRARRAPQWAKR
jgi:small subunit ribosomal protein S9